MFCVWLTSRLGLVVCINFQSVQVFFLTLFIISFLIIMFRSLRDNKIVQFQRMFLRIGACSLVGDRGRKHLMQWSKDATGGGEFEFFNVSRKLVFWSQGGGQICSPLIVHGFVVSDHWIGSNFFSWLRVCLLYIPYFQTTCPMCTCLFL